MTSQIVDIIRELIVEYNYVTVPQLGGFVSNYQAAQVLTEKNIILPPSKKISFNSNLNEDDGLLVTSIASAFNLTIQDAKNTVDSFVQNIFKKLESGKSVRFTKIGTLKFNNELNVEFESESNENLNPYSYGMVKTVCRKLDTPTLIKEKQSIWLSRKTLIRAAVLIPFFVIGSLLSVHLHQIGFFQNSLQQMASIIDWSSETKTITELEPKANPSEFTETMVEFDNPVEQAIEEKTNRTNALDYIEPSKTNVENKVFDISEVPQTTKNIVSNIKVEEKSIVVKKKQNTHDSNALQKYQVVAGSFKSKDNANRLANKIRALNYQSVVIKLDNRYRVIAASFSQKNKAKEVKNDLKSKSISTWINTAK